MKPIDNTNKQIDFFHSIGIDKFDAAVNKKGSSFLFNNTQNFNRDLLIEKYINFLKYRNAMRQADVYIRPARGQDWSYCFLDDLAIESVKLIQKKYTSCSIHTSNEGGYQIWIETNRTLSEDERLIVNRHLVNQFNGDPGSVSGEHWGRIAGFTNQKRGGNEWVNHHSTVIVNALDADQILNDFEHISSIKTVINTAAHCASKLNVSNKNSASHECDSSESGKEFGWAYGAIQSGIDPDVIQKKLADRARDRGKIQPENYAMRTVNKVLDVIARV